MGGRIHNAVWRGTLIRKHLRETAHVLTWDLYAQMLPRLTESGTGKEDGFAPCATEGADVESR